MMWPTIRDIGGSRAGDSSLTAETELFVLELGFRAAFDLFHHDDVVFDPEPL
jgi:hypothetical protein